jgi:peptidoglycan/xylan/chitin deacetylase (PgdA/CDA1 family)
VHPHLAVWPLAAFVLACLLLPLAATVPFFFPVISRGRRVGVSLTFDDGPDPLSTPPLLALLARHRVRATFFVTGERARRYPELLAAILAHGHALGNHSFTHDNWIMFRRPAFIQDEILATQQAIASTGVVPTLFRPPVGILTPAYGPALRASGLAALTFSRRARDMGNRRIRGMAGRILRRLYSGDIILLHDTPPRRGGLDGWLAEIDGIIAGCRARELAILPLEILIDRPVMRPTPEA